LKIHFLRGISNLVNAPNS